MSLLEIFLLACALAVDAFSVGAAVGLKHRQPRQIFRLSFHFGLFQALFPLMGALAGALVLSTIQAWDHWIIFGLLGALGTRMLIGAFHGEDASRREVDLTRGMHMVGLSTAVSIDALAAGVTLSVARAPLVLSVTIIGIVAALATVVAMVGANRFSAKLGKRAEGVAGVVLILLGTRALLVDLGLLRMPF
jgi:putative Mn2+ efflux pump MntP